MTLIFLLNVDWYCSEQDSLQRNRMTRFYLKQKEDPHGPSISLFVGNLPTGWAQRQYEKLLLDFITPGTCTTSLFVKLLGQRHRETSLLTIKSTPILVWFIMAVLNKLEFVRKISVLI